MRWFRYSYAHICLFIAYSLRFPINPSFITNTRVRFDSVSNQVMILKCMPQKTECFSDLHIYGIFTDFHAICNLLIG
jgi:hypothetical protein